MSCDTCINSLYKNTSGTQANAFTLTHNPSTVMQSSTQCIFARGLARAVEINNSGINFLVIVHNSPLKTWSLDLSPQSGVFLLNKADPVEVNLC